MERKKIENEKNKNKKSLNWVNIKQRQQKLKMTKNRSIG